MKYKIGDKVTIKSLDWYNKCEKDIAGTIHIYPCFTLVMSSCCGKTYEVAEVLLNDTYYLKETEYRWNADFFELKKMQKEFDFC